MQNSLKSKSKLSKLEKIMNFQILLMFMIQVSFNFEIY